MRIERIIIRGLRALGSRDDSFKAPGGGVFDAICLRGLTGSGKTTYLEALAQLWQWFRRCTKKRGYENPTSSGLLAEADLVAALFTDLPGPMPRMWIAVGPASTLKETISQTSECPYAIQRDRAVWNQKVLAFWDEAMTRAEAGVLGEGGAIPPNLVWIEAENKYVPELRRNELTESRPAPVFLPVGRYSSRGSTHLEAIMRELYLARPERWRILAESVRTLRPSLELADRFEESSQRPIFRLASGEYINVERLSAGERSLLINLCMILRWLTSGGIVMIDEPELHQHLSLMRGSLSVIANLVSETFNGQLLVASHAPEVWDHMRITGTFLDLGNS